MNVPVVGFLIGLVAPLAGFMVMYLLWGSGVPLPEFYSNVTTSHDQGSKVFTLSLLANLVPFVIFNSRRYYQASQGVFTITMVFVVLIVLYKFVW